MHISLDYYRILTIPIKANQEQIDRAYEDRIQQKPRREYSDVAIVSRRSLLQQAYHLLSDDGERAIYDGKFLAKLQQESSSIVEKPESETSKNNHTLHKILLSLDEAVSLESKRIEGQTASTLTIGDIKQSPQNQEIPETESEGVYLTIEIPPKFLVGALIILHELAEYEQVIRLGNEYLNDSAYSDEFEAELAGARSSLNLASEEDNLTVDEINPKKDIILAMALSYLELGREKWRIQDYETAACCAQIGFDLLEQEQLFYMLQEELTTDLHKLRPYRILDLLANSPANSDQRATGLALLKEMLHQRQGIEGKGEDYSGLKFDKFLGFIQQVRNYLTTPEQIELFETEANRASFVGTYLAMYALLAQGYATKQPNLILKAQEMLGFLSEGQEEVHWEQAVCCLLLGQAKQAQIAIEQSQEKATVELIRQYSQDAPDLLPGLCFYSEKWLLREVLSQFRDLENYQVTLDDYFADIKVQRYLEQLSPVPIQPQNAPKFQETKAVSNSKKTTFPHWVSWNKSDRQPKYAHAPGNTRTSNSQAKSRSSTVTLEKEIAILSEKQIKQRTNTQSPTGGNKQPRKKKRGVTSHKNKKASSNFMKGSLLSLGLILGLGALGFVFTRSMLQMASKSTPSNSSTSVQETEPTSNIEEPVITLSQVEIEPEVPEKPQIFDTTIAKNVVETWLDSKSAALGNQHNIDELNKILVSSQIAKWRGIALQDKNNNIYRQYKHNVTILDVDFSENQPTQATVEAQIEETTQYYQRGKSTSFKSDDDNLVVRYQLIRQGESWLINKSELLKSL